MEIEGEEKMYTSGQVARLLGVRRHNVKYWMWSGKISVSKIPLPKGGYRYGIGESEIRRFKKSMSLELEKLRDINLQNKTKQTSLVCWPGNYEVDPEDVMCPRCGSEQIRFFFTVPKFFEKRISDVTRKGNDDFVNADWVCENCNHRWSSRVFMIKILIGVNWLLGKTITMEINSKLNDVVCPKCGSERVGFFFNVSELFEKRGPRVVRKRNVDFVDAEWVCENCNYRWFSRVCVKGVRVRHFGLEKVLAKRQSR